MEGERQTLFSQATTSGTSAFEPTTQESLTRIALTGVFIKLYMANFASWMEHCVVRNKQMLQTSRATVCMYTAVLFTLLLASLQSQLLEHFF